jgi:hypothetical protein
VVEHVCLMLEGLETAPKKNEKMKKNRSCFGAFGDVFLGLVCVYFFFCCLQEMLTTQFCFTKFNIA